MPRFEATDDPQPGQRVRFMDSYSKEILPNAVHDHYYVGRNPMTQNHLTTTKNGSVSTWVDTLTAMVEVDITPVELTNEERRLLRQIVRSSRGLSTDEQANLLELLS